MFTKRLPIELVNIILQYDNIIKYRNGIFMNQININNLKYNLIKENIKNKLKIISKAKIINNGFIIDSIICKKKFNIKYHYFYNKINSIYTFTFSRILDDTLFTFLMIIIYKFLYMLEYNNTIPIEYIFK
jgi:hypothetical protein